MIVKIISAVVVWKKRKQPVPGLNLLNSDVSKSVTQRKEYIVQME